MKKSNIASFIAGAIIFGSVGVFAEQYNATDNPFPIQLNGSSVSIEGYNINGSTYFKLRDIADVVGGFWVNFYDNTIRISNNESAREAEEKAAVEAAAKAEAAARQVNSIQKAISKVKELRQATGDALQDDFMGNTYSAEEYTQYYIVDVTATQNVDGTSRYKVYKSNGNIEYLGAGSEW